MGVIVKSNEITFMLDLNLDLSIIRTDNVLPIFNLYTSHPFELNANVFNQTTTVRKNKVISYNLC